MGGVGGYLSAGGGASSAPAAEVSGPGFVRGVVQGLSADRLTLTTDSGPLELGLEANAPVEALRPTSFEGIAAGDWLNGGAIAHAQTLFALVGIVIISPAQLDSQR
jgi:hypothetical protein